MCQNFQKQGKTIAHTKFISSHHKIMTDLFEVFSWRAENTETCALYIIHMLCYIPHAIQLKAKKSQMWFKL